MKNINQPHDLSEDLTTTAEITFVSNTPETFHKLGQMCAMKK